MKSLRRTFVLGLGLTVLAAAALNAETISISWNTVEQAPPLNEGLFLPRVASDWVYGSILMYQNGPGFTGIGYQDGNGNPPGGPLTGVDWCCYPGNSMNSEVGKATSVGLANATNANGVTHDTALEVHQGGQDGGSLLWYSLGTAKLSSSQRIPDTVNWAASQSYDNGFNPTVGVDNSYYLANPVNAAVVEVHQAASGRSDLWYHFGLLMGINGSSPSMAWFPATQVQYTSSGNATSISGNFPSVSLSDGLAVLVYQGGSGDLYYSIGVNDIFAGITWSAPVNYTSGYNPSISVYGCPGCAGWTVVEAHQSNTASDGGGTLFYRTGTIDRSGTVLGGGAKIPTLKWMPDRDRSYDTGCYPSVATNGVYVWEVHQNSCGDSNGLPDLVYSKFGQLVYSF